MRIPAQTRITMPAANWAISSCPADAKISCFGCPRLYSEWIFSPKFGNRFITTRAQNNCLVFMKNESADSKAMSTGVNQKGQSTKVVEICIGTKANKTVAASYKEVV
ncbi:unnamed protein product [Heterosigma akashiwo]